MFMTTDEIRRKFLEFFREHGHTIVRSSPLVPQNDSTLLFTNAGMNQFKDVYLGRDRRDYLRAATAQKCVRAGGKQNDLDNVGYTARHHTFFEMLGNFSFGDYFKKEAITYAWTLLTEGYGLPPESLMVTVYDKDDEAYGIWKDVIGLPESKIVRIGDNKGGAFNSDNFWQMGDTGPCGPCSEIFYDHGPDIPGGPPGSPDEDGDRFIEIWNVVFMQYNRHADGTFEKLAKPMIDNGLGLERIAAVLQGVHSNYEIDLFVSLIDEVARVLGVSDKSSKSLRVIADHIRSCSFLIADGVLPSNEGRGYVLRRIIRRAVRHGRMLGAREVFFYRLVGKLADLMGDAYPELRERQSVIEDALKQEEEQFLKTLDRGLALLEQELTALGEARVVPGETVFRLYDTFGFPVDLTADVVRDRGYRLDMHGFEKCMEEQRRRAKEASSFGVDYNLAVKLTEQTEFCGYSTLSSPARVLAVLRDGQRVESAATDEHAVVVLDVTPFYAEMGGQVGDRGVISFPEGEFEVEDTQHNGRAVMHIGRVRLGVISDKAMVTAKVDAKIRATTAAHHSATHLLDAALREVLGGGVQQKGSYVAPDRLRFDYSYNHPLTLDVRQKIEMLINEQIRANHEVKTEIMNLDEARASGAIALFGEKYEDRVRVVSMGSFSKELCGGTHVSRTGDIGGVVIISDEAVASGIRRIEARCGQAAMEFLQKQQTLIAQICTFMQTDSFSMADRVRQLVDYCKSQEKETEALKRRLVASECANLTENALRHGDVAVLVEQLREYDAHDMRTAADYFRERLGKCVVVLGSVRDGKVSLLASVSPEVSRIIRAGDLIKAVAPLVDGRGGGKAEMAQAGGSKPAGLGDALAAARRQIIGTLEGQK